MSVHLVYYKDGVKMMRPVLDREEYLRLRDGDHQKSNLSRIRQGEVSLKGDLVQMNYSCLPNEDGTLKGSKTASTSVCMDIDFKAPEGLSEEERKAWLSEQMAKVPELVMNKKDELVPLMLERSATKGYHLAFRRRPDLDQEGNLKWASDLLGIKFDAQAKDIRGSSLMYRPKTSRGCTIQRRPTLRNCCIWMTRFLVWKLLTLLQRCSVAVQIPRLFIPQTRKTILRTTTGFPLRRS